MPHQVFTSSGVFTAPISGIYKVYLISGGGNGGNGAASTYAGGGGAAGTVSIISEYLKAGQQVAVTRNSATTTVAGAGGSVSFGSYLTVAGGQGGETANGNRGRGGSGNGGLGGGRECSSTTTYGQKKHNVWDGNHFGGGSDSSATGNSLTVEFFSSHGSIAQLSPTIHVCCGTISFNSNGAGGAGGYGGGGGAGGQHSAGQGGGGAGGFMTRFTGNTIYGAGGRGGNVNGSANRTNGLPGVVIVEWIEMEV